MDGLTILRLITFAVAATCLVLILRAQPRQAVHFAATGHTSAMMLAALYGAVGSALGPLAPAIHLAGIASCGWFWLFARVLFRPGEVIKPWMIGVVALITAPFALDKFFAASPWLSATLGAEGLLRMAYNVERLVSSTVLALGVLEALRNYDHQNEAEKRFRTGFVALFGALIALAMIWLRGSPETSFAGQAGDAIRASFMMLAAMASVYAVRHRMRVHVARPELAQASTKRSRLAATPTDEDTSLAAQITTYVADPSVFTSPDVKVAHIADRLGAPEYKVTRAISRATRFANFNRLINHHRIEMAKERLANKSDQHTPILTIALESGFGSIGPFNRAFKEEVGVTPRAYRTAQLEPPSTSSTQAGTTSPALP